MNRVIDADSVERAADVAASACLAAAAGFAVSGLAPAAGPVAWFAAAAAFTIVHHGLRQVGDGERQYPLPAFSPPAFPPPVLSQAPIAPVEEARPEAGELLLDDRLAAAGPDARVVRLFDPRRMAGAGDTGARAVRRHQAGRPAPASRDASRELSQALAELRRSLR
jgi:hypothetical protein